MTGTPWRATIASATLLIFAGVFAGAGGHAADLSPDVLEKMVETQGGAVLGGLDKVTARVSKIYAPVDVPVQFGSLQITVRKCNKRPPEETPEQTVFMEVDDLKPDHTAARVFTGWMFWSSPARHALEHPVYDVWLTDCSMIAGSQPGPMPSDSQSFEPGVLPQYDLDAAPIETPSPEVDPNAPLSPRLPPPG